MVTFRVTRGRAVVVQRDYPVSAGLLDGGADPTPFAGAGDFDLLLLVANVMSDPPRRERIFAAPPARP